MPRDGSNIYHTPPGTDGIPNTTIASTPYNGYLADIAQDLNLPRPIVAGGTGANSAAQALINLGGELAGQVVTNYDSFPFKSGSFTSAAGATGAPTANAFRGISYITDSNNITIEARDNTTGLLYIRTKTAGVWAAWAIDPSYVAKTGDTMTGDLKLSVTAPDFILNKASGTAGTQNNIWGQTNNVPRWVMQLGNETSESGANLGSNFTLERYSDAGAFLSDALLIRRDDGEAYFYGDIHVAPFANKGSVHFGESGTKFLYYDGSNFILSTSLTITGGFVHAGSHVASAESSTNGTYYFGDIANAKYLNFNGTSFTLTGGPLYCSDFVAANGYQSKAGLAGGTTVDYYNHYWTGANTQLWLNSLNLGNITIASDYRIKKDVIDLPEMWQTVKKLHPIKYRHKDFSPFSHTSDKPLFKADETERWGFIAHELQDTLLPSAANGVKDAPDEIQSPNPLTVIAALTKALQEAMSRIEALEAKT